jgi:broad specificity phosphatase PhoE
VTRYWLVRHGESVANAEGWLAGHRDVDLTDRGVEQARALRPVLAELRPERVVSSDLLRAVRTASLAWDHRLPPVERALQVRERDLGAWEGRPIQELQRAGHGDVLVSWGYGPPGGESHQQLAIRALSWLSSIDDGRDTLIFGHGGWIRAVIGVLDGTPLDQIGRFKVENTQVLARDVAPGTWSALLERIED